MIKSIIMLCAESVIRDYQTNSISVINILEGIDGFGFPMIVPKITIFNLYERTKNDPNEFTNEVKILIGKEEIINEKIEMSFKEKLRTRSMIVLSGLAIPKPGTLRIITYANDKKTGEYKVSVGEVKPKIKKLNP